MGQVAKKLGQRVAEYRQQAGLTQGKLAEKVGVADETISRLERGAVTPSLERMEQVAAALGIELHELFQFRVRENEKEKAMRRLHAILRRHDAGEIDALTEIAVRILARWK
jgi:transcriptional regulator with XRE-family HTH domain